MRNGLKVDFYERMKDMRDSVLLVVKTGLGSEVWNEFRCLSDFTPVWVGGQRAGL